MENIHTEGTFINLKISRDQKINSPDYKRVYACGTVRPPSEKMIAYFERKFMTSAKPDVLKLPTLPQA